MPQATILAAGQAPATSATITIAAGASHTLGLFTANAIGIPPQTAITVEAVTPGSKRHIATLTGVGKPTLLSGPLQYTVTRGDITYGGVDVGVWQES